MTDIVSQIREIVLAKFTQIEELKAKLTVFLKQNSRIFRSQIFNFSYIGKLLNFLNQIRVFLVELLEDIFVFLLKQIAHF